MHTTVVRAITGSAFFNDFYGRCDCSCLGKIPAHQCKAFPRERRAFEYFEKAALLGNTEAMYKLGDCYAEGLGCTKDHNKAFDLYLSAYQQSQTEESYVWGSCAYRLAGCYERASGVGLDFAKSLEYYRKA